MTTNNARVAMYAVCFAACLILLAASLGAATYLKATATPECENGIQYTEWCGCEPALYGDDC